MSLLTLFNQAPAQQSVVTPASVAGSSIGTSSAATVTVATPANVTSGMFLLAFLSDNGDSTAPAQTGWTTIDYTGSSTTAFLAAYYKYATASEPASYTFTATGST